MASPLYVPGGSSGPVPPGTIFGRAVVRSNDADVVLVAGDEDIYVFLRNLSASRTVTFPAAPMVGQIIAVKDEDGSLAAQTIVVDGNGNTIDGAATLTMSLANVGVKSSLTFIYQGAGWSIV